IIQEIEGRNSSKDEAELVKKREDKSRAKDVGGRMNFSGAPQKGLQSHGIKNSSYHHLENMLEKKPMKS
ncbi:MAG: hypothetical protein ACK56F_21870, partial [bacterium]